MVIRTDNGEFEFRVLCPDAQQMFLVGDFGGSSEVAYRMRLTPTGEWVCRLRLEEGVYEYRYHVDGQLSANLVGTDLDWAPFGSNVLLVTEQSEMPAFPVG